MTRTLAFLLMATVAAAAIVPAGCSDSDEPPAADDPPAETAQAPADLPAADPQSANSDGRAADAAHSPAGDAAEYVSLAEVEKELERCGYVRGLKGWGTQIEADVELEGVAVRRIYYPLDADLRLPSVAVYVDRVTRQRFLGLESMTSSKPPTPVLKIDEVIQNDRHSRMTRLLMNRLAGKSLYPSKSGQPVTTTLPGFELIITDAGRATKWKIRRRTVRRVSP